MSPRSSLVGRLLVVQATGVGGGVVAANVGAGSQLTQTVEAGEYDDVTVAGAYALVGQDGLLADTVAELAYLPIACDRFEDFVDSLRRPGR